MRGHDHPARGHPVPLGPPGLSKSWGGMGWATTSALGGWPLVRSPSVMDELRELSPTGGGSATCVDLSGRPQGSCDSAVSPYSRSAFGPVPLSRSDAHGIGRGGHYQGRHLPFHQGPATHTPRDERTELVSFHRSAKAPHRRRGIFRFSPRSARFLTRWDQHARDRERGRRVI